jgi:glycosyltransferase involved in cell wall biosynthesis
MNAPLVTVICVCCNHHRFVCQALNSVIHQTYPNIELIVIDDASTDGSVKAIKRWAASYPEITLIMNTKNLGYCKTFNKAFRLAKGEFIIDLAADDVLLPGRVETGVQVLTTAGKEYGVTFSDAEYIDAAGKVLRTHARKFPHATIPQGDVYKHLVERFFICPPSMMVRKAVLDVLQGYDESLAYEDFDFWIRSSRQFKYVYSPKVLVQKRELANSLGVRQFKRNSPQRWSTLAVCKKIKSLNRHPDETAALKKRLHYEIRQSVRLFEFALAREFWRLLRTL